MFKSSQHLREAAAQRQLDRVASSWRQARTTWFDGTPESIEARLSETNRLLTVARSDQTPAHIGLSVEAENARRELLAAKHRLLNDFLDDGARAFKGSKRVARGRTAAGFPGVNPAGQAEMAARAESELDPEMYGNYHDGPDSGRCRHCEEEIEERGDGSYGHVLGINPHTGDTTFYPSDHPAQPDDEDYHTARRTAATVTDFDDQLLFSTE